MWRILRTFQDCWCCRWSERAEGLRESSAWLQKSPRFSTRSLSLEWEKWWNLYREWFPIYLHTSFYRPVKLTFGGISLMKASSIKIWAWIHYPDRWGLDSHSCLFLRPNSYYYNNGFKASKFECSKTWGLTKRTLLFHPSCPRGGYLLFTRDPLWSQLKWGGGILSKTYQLFSVYFESLAKVVS